VTVTAPVLSIIKTSDVSDADPGDTITYTIFYENTGTGWASLVEIVDTIPGDTTLTGSTPGYNSSSGDEFTWEIGDLAPGGNGTITITVTVDAGTPDTTILHNIVTMDYADANGNYYDQLNSSANVTVTAPVITITKTANVPNADPDDGIVYTLYYENTGTGDATDVVIVDILPADVTFLSASEEEDSIVGNVVTWIIGIVNASEDGTITVTVKVNVGTGDKTVLHNVARLNYSDDNGNFIEQVEDDANVTVTAPVLNITKIADVSNADPGDFIVYTIEYVNTGTGWATLVEIVDKIPALTTIFGSTPGYNSSLGDEYTWLIGDVGPGSGGTITITVTVDVGTPDKTLLHNLVTLDYADASGNYYAQLNATADVVVKAPVITISKVADKSEADPGDEITYTLYYENTGTGNATNVIVVDTLPPEVTFISTSVTPEPPVGNTITWIIGTVNALTNGTITVTVRVDPGTEDETLLHNVATLNYSDANGNFIEQVEDFADVTVTAPNIILDKDAGDITVAAYVTADFRLRIAGEKWHNVELTLYNDNVSVAVAGITRYPGDPDDQSVTIYNVTIDLLSDSYSAVIVYTPEDDPINGQWWGANPCWLIMTFEDGSEKRLKHTFNVRHESTWIWTIDDFTPYFKHAPITYEATIPYTITYENTGAGNATNVSIVDTLPAGAVLLNSSTLPDSCVGNVCTWYIGDVDSGEMGYIFVNITYIFHVDGTIVTNHVTLDCSDSNGNFFAQVSAFAMTALEVPELGYSPPGIWWDNAPGMEFTGDESSIESDGPADEVPLKPSGTFEVSNEPTQSLVKVDAISVGSTTPQEDVATQDYIADTTGEGPSSIHAEEVDVESIGEDDGDCEDKDLPEESRDSEDLRQGESSSQGLVASSDFQAVVMETRMLREW
jgi:uncharacterized repeat protein (TIGR01451 family)